MLKFSEISQGGICSFLITVRFSALPTSRPQPSRLAQIPTPADLLGPNSKIAGVLSWSAATVARSVSLPLAVNQTERNPMRGIIIQPEHFLGPGPEPPDEMVRGLKGLEVQLKPCQGPQMSLLDECFVIHAKDILLGLCERRWSNECVFRFFQFWNRRYVYGTVKLFRVPRGAVQLLQ